MRYTKTMENEEEQEIQTGFTLLVAGLLAVGAPLLLILFRSFVVQYELVEELVKLFIVLYLVRELGSRVRWYYLAGMGWLFGMSETMLYVMNAMTVGSYDGLMLRSVVTVPMHALTPVIMLTIGRKNKGVWWAAAYGVAVLVHVVFNQFVR